MSFLLRGILPRLSPRFATFLIIWLGQTVSILGSGLTGFAVGVWVYQQTGSVTNFALTILSITLPSMAVTPFAGDFVDRHDRRKVMILGDTVSAVFSVLIATLLLTENLEVWSMCLALIGGAVANVFHGLAFTALTTQLVSKEHYGHVSGLRSIGPAASRILAPLLAGALLALIEFEGVILIDFATYFVALGTLLFVRTPTYAGAEDARNEEQPLFRRMLRGWVFIKSRAGLLYLLAFFAVINASLSMTVVLFLPLLMTLASVETVGVVLSVGSAGLLAGSLVMGAWGGPKRRIYGVLGFGAFLSVCMALVGFRPSVVLVAAMYFLVLFAAPIVNGCSQAIWQSKTPLNLQGRVFATRVIVARSMTPLGYLVAGPLADKIFEPLMAPDGGLAPLLGPLLGVGEGRGIGLFFVLIGIVALLTTLGGMLSPRLRHLEDLLPDAIDDETPTAEEPSTVIEESAAPV